MKTTDQAVDRPPLDMHVHIIGNGRSGSGCWSRLNWFRQFTSHIMLRSIGLPMSLDAIDFDERYAEHVAREVGQSSLAHAVILAHEEVYHEDGQKRNFGSFHVPNDYVLSLGKKYPQFLPAVSIHPARPDACHELERCAEQGAVMVKILPPSQNIDCSRPAYRDFFKLMAALRLPLLSHTGGEYTVPVCDRRLFDPGLLRQPLDCGVTVVAAHFASRSAPAWIETDYLPAFLQMLKDYPQLYADNSALNTPNRSHVLRTCLREEWVDRVVHGSDYPVPVNGHWARWRGHVSRTAVTESHQSPNLIERDYLLKKHMGFPATSFTRMWDLLPPSAVA
jgi:uncharacterized protein